MIRCPFSCFSCVDDVVCVVVVVVTIDFVFTVVVIFDIVGPSKQVLNHVQNQVSNILDIDVIFFYCCCCYCCSPY